MYPAQQVPYSAAAIPCGKRLFCYTVKWRKGLIAPGWYEEKDSSYSSDRKARKIATVAWQVSKLINSVPPSSSDDLCLLFCMNPSSMVNCLSSTFKVQVLHNAPAYLVCGHNDPGVATPVLYNGHAGDLLQPDVLHAGTAHVGVARRGAAQHVPLHPRDMEKSIKNKPT